MDDESDNEQDGQVQQSDSGDQLAQDRMDIIDSDAIQVAATQIRSTASTTKSGGQDSSRGQRENEVIELDSQEEDSRSPTPLFVSRSASPTCSNSSSFFAMQLLGDADFGIVVPPVTSRWEYQTIDHDPRVRKILKKFKEADVVHYIVKTRDGRSMTVSDCLEVDFAVMGHLAADFVSYITLTFSLPRLLLASIFCLS